MSQSEPRPFQPTRQQLDELEALMQRMLALPVEPPETEAASVPPPIVETAGIPELAEPEPTPLPSSTQFTQREPVPVSVAVTPEPVFIVPQPEPPALPAEAVPAARPVHRRPRVDWWVRPLLWSNRTFDRCTIPLGDPGRWLRSRRGRSWLGYTGIVFFATALAWEVLDWMGWL
jgi:hypothetical protein